MKIDKVTYEVDLSDGDKRPIYVWEAPVRVWHWLMVVTMFTMIVTGYLIGRSSGCQSGKYLGDVPVR